MVSLAPATFRYQAHPDDDTDLSTRIRGLATRYPRYGYRRITALLRQTERVNHKRVRRVWHQQELQVKRLRRLRPRRSRPTQLAATHPGQIWAYDFVEDALANGTPFKVLTVMDEFTREGLALDVAHTTSAERVIGVLAALFAQHGAPSYLRSDNGAEFGLKPCNSGFGTAAYRRSILSQASRGKMERRNGSTARCAMNV